MGLLHELCDAACSAELVPEGVGSIVSRVSQSLSYSQSPSASVSKRVAQGQFACADETGEARRSDRIRHQGCGQRGGSLGAWEPGSSRRQNRPHNHDIKVCSYTQVSTESLGSARALSLSSCSAFFPFFFFLFFTIIIIIIIIILFLFLFLFYRAFLLPTDELRRLALLLAYWAMTEEEQRVGWLVGRVPCLLVHEEGSR